MYAIHGVDVIDNRLHKHGKELGLGNELGYIIPNSIVTTPDAWVITTNSPIIRFDLMFQVFDGLVPHTSGCENIHDMFGVKMFIQATPVEAVSKFIHLLTT